MAVVRLRQARLHAAAAGRVSDAGAIEEIAKRLEHQP